ncbi:MAG: hypothetical protein VW551_06095 [Euryarchaeota archaeon]|jgi:hypothetical protein
MSEKKRLKLKQRAMDMVVSKISRPQLSRNANRIHALDEVVDKVKITVDPATLLVLTKLREEIRVESETLWDSAYKEVVMELLERCDELTKELRKEKKANA